MLPSTAKNDTISRIVPVLKNDINYVVTEFGVAQLRGRSAGQRAGADRDCASGFPGGVDGAGWADGDSLRRAGLAGVECWPLGIGAGGLSLALLILWAVGDLINI